MQLSSCDVCMQLGSCDVCMQLGSWDVCMQLSSCDVCMQLSSWDVCMQLKLMPPQRLQKHWQDSCRTRVDSNRCAIWAEAHSIVTTK